MTQVPGNMMICQGTDGLSHGVWISPLSYCAANDTADLFQMVPPLPKVLQWALDQIGSLILPHLWGLQTDLSDWELSTLIGQHTLWLLSPVIAHQGFITAAMAWIESPWNSLHIFVVPCIMQWEFRSVNKIIIFILQSLTLPLPHDFYPLIPFVFLSAPFL